jgi:type VI protein secretion system component VasF
MPALSDSQSNRVARRKRHGAVTPVEALAVIVVVAAVIALAVWFIFFSSGGIGPGTV